MENKFSDIDDVFRNALSSLEVEPSPESWEKISTQLSQTENKKRFRTLFFWLGIISIVSAFIIGAFVPFANEIKTEKNRVAEKKQVQKQERAPEENHNKQQNQNTGKNIQIENFYMKGDKVTVEIKGYNDYNEQTDGYIESLSNLSDDEIFTIVEDMITCFKYYEM